MLLSDIDWEAWVPGDIATVMFVVRGGEILLIRKLRGFGAGKINAPGGRLETGESLVECAVRETREEVGVTPLEPRFRGELRFAFVSGYRLEVHIFSADGCEGEVRASDEAIPLWTPLAEIPFGEMWADDRLWLPLMLAGRTPFSGRFVFDEDTLGDYVLTAHDPAEALFEKLQELDIAYEMHAHAPVFTVTEAKRERPLVKSGETGLHTKNLFVRNKKGRMWLVTLEEDRAVDLKALAKRLGTDNLSFASAARLRTHLGVEPGSVTPLAVMHDSDGLVTMVLDRALTYGSVWCHPLTNDRTIRMAGEDLVRFLAATGHAPVVIDLE